MKLNAKIVLLYSFLIMAGGVMGYVKGSTASLIAGGGSGLLIAICGLLLLIKPENLKGFYAAIIMIVCLCGLSGYRLWGALQAPEPKLMPNAGILGLSLIVLIVLLLRSSKK